MAFRCDKRYLKVLVFSHEYPPQIGGAGVVAKQYLTELISAGVDASLLTKHRKGIENLIHPNIKLITIPENSKIWFLDYKKN